MRLVPVLLACLLPLLLPPAARAGADDVTIYRCTDAGGRLTLRDSPCAKGERQQTRTMLRPKDGTPAPVAPPAIHGAAPAAATRVVVVSPPRPLYECTTPDGDRYTSDTAEGNPRWVPLWTLGYPGYVPGDWRHWRGGQTRSSIDIRSGGVHIHGDTGGGGFDRGDGRHRGRPPIALAGPAGTWIRDSCHALPPQEVCARLVDRRDEIRRRFFNAMPSERAVLDVEERGINARLDNDCGGH